MSARTVPFLAGLIALVAMAILGFTPIAWHLQGRPSESYPEFMFVALGMPLSLISTVAGALLVWNSASRAASNIFGLRIVSVLSLVGCGTLLAITFAPTDLASSGMLGFALNALFIGALLLGLAMVILAIIPGTTIGRRVS